MHGEAVFVGFTGSGGCARSSGRERSRRRPNAEDKPIERGEVVAAVTGDSQFRARPDGRPPAPCSGGRASDLASGADRRIGLHVARSRGGDRRTRAQGGLSDGMELHARRGPELQKKAFCQASKIARTWRAIGRGGKNIRAGLTLRASSLSTKPGPRPT